MVHETCRCLSQTKPKTLSEEEEVKKEKWKRRTNVQNDIPSRQKKRVERRVIARESSGGVVLKQKSSMPCDACETISVDVAGLVLRVLRWLYRQVLRKAVLTALH